MKRNWKLISICWAFIKHETFKWLALMAMTISISDNILAQSINYAVNVDFTTNAPHREIGLEINVGTNNHNRGYTYSPDGSTMRTIDNDENDIQQYSLSIPFDLNSSVTFQGTSPQLQNISGVGVILPEAIAFNNDGTVLFVLESFGDRIIQFNLATPYSVISGSLSASGSYQG